jgi:hypothetical protein
MRCAAVLAGCLVAIFMSGCADRQAPPAPSVDTATVEAPGASPTQQELSRLAVQHYFRTEPSSAVNLPAALPGTYIPPPQDGWVADWGLWADIDDKQARDLYQSIPKELALKYSFGEPKKELVVFTDPYSQNDRRFYRILDNATETMDAVVYVFPLQGRLEVGNVARILCTANPEKSWWDWMMLIAPSRLDAIAIETPRLDPAEEIRLWSVWKQQHPQMLSCENKDRGDLIGKLASDLGVSHTPTLVFANGRAWPSPVVEWSDIQQSWDYVHGRQGIKLSK